MTIKPIKTERDYQRTLKEIDKLWDAKPNTAEGDRLDVLVTLVEATSKNITGLILPIRSKPSSSAWNSLSSSRRIWRIFSAAGTECRKFSIKKES